MINEFSETSGLINGKIRMFYYLSVFSIHLYFKLWQNEIFPDIHLYQLIFFATQISLHSNLLYYFYVFLLHTPLFRYIININFLRDFFKFIYILSFVVVLNYWGVVAIDKKLIYMEENPFPFLLDLFVHGGNLLFNVMDQACILPKQNSRRINFKLLFIINIAYSIMLRIVYTHGGIILYPLAANIISLSIMTLGSTCSLMIAIYTYDKLIKRNSNK